MDVDDLSQIKKFALSLSAPLTATGSNEEYSKLGYWQEDTVAAQLKSWWGIETRKDLEENLVWLDKEGGHTVVFNKQYIEMREMTYLERDNYVESLRYGEWGDYIRACTVHRYLGALSRHTIRAFDIARYAMLAQAGYTRGWFTEEESWNHLISQAKTIALQRMFPSHFDYLLSYYVGRTYSMKHGFDAVVNSMYEARKLLVNNNSPFLTFAPWPDFDLLSMEDHQHV